MKSTGLFLLAALALFACAAPPLRVATAPEPSSFPSCKDRNVVDEHDKPDGNLFVSKRVFLLQDNTFDPSTSSGYSAPTGPTAANSIYAADLSAAFNAAPRFFQEQLCGLDGVFVNLKCKDPNNCTPGDAADNSWGYRETLAQNPQEPARRFIAISAVLWGANPHVDNFYDFESKLLYELFRRRYNVTWTGPQYGDQTNHPENTPTTTVLWSLAHEFGHVLWHDTFRPTRSLGEADNDFSRFCNGTFFDGSWQPVPQSDGSSQPVFPPRHWRAFGERSPQPHIFGDVQIDQIDDAIRRGAPVDRAYYLDGIYRKDGRWTGFFAALSADEDFIETFRFHVLRKAKTPLKNLPITIPSVPPYAFHEDVPKDHSMGQKQNKVLKAKVDCFESVYH